MLAELKRAKVKLLVDTRAVAASRRPGFSKRQLAASLDEAGIALSAFAEARHAGRGPRGGARRRPRRRSGRSTRKHLKTKDAIAEMEELIALVEGGKRVCLLCYERDVGHCHRSKIAEIVTERTGARGHRSGATAVLIFYSAGCATLRSRSTPLTRIATNAVPMTKPSATTAVTASTRSKPPRLCSSAIIETAAPDIR